MEDKKDTRFQIKASFNKEGPAKYEYKSFQEEIKNNGGFTVNKVRIYTPELTFILFSKELPAFNMDTKEQIILNCFPYFETYVKAFNEGVKYFDNEFAILPNTLYGVNAKQYVRDIHFNYFHKRLKGSFTGWHFVEEQYPGILTHKEISKFGYYSGIVSRVEEMAKNYPHLFQDFDKCEYDVHPQPTETKAEQVKPNFKKILTEIKDSENQLLKGLPMKNVIKHFEIMTKKKNKNGNVFLTIEQLISFLKKGFLNDTTQPKQKINCSSGEKGFVIKRFYEFFDLAVSQYSYPQKKEIFIKLFTDCFDNWKQTTIKPFFKPNKTKQKW